MSYRTVPEPLPKPPKYYFAAIATENIYVSDANWLQRTFPPFPFVCARYGHCSFREERRYCCQIVVLLASVFYFFGALGFCTTVGIGFVFGALGSMGLFHRNLKVVEWSCEKQE
jgi:hypothetical protein